MCIDSPSSPSESIGLSRPTVHRTIAACHEATCHAGTATPRPRSTRSART